MPQTILALEKDLFFSVKMRDTLRHHDFDVIAARNLNIFEQALVVQENKPVLVIVNTATKGVDWEAAIRSARAHELPVLAFGSHMDLEARRRALEAGALKVVANSKFATDMPGLVGRMLAPVGVSAPEDDSEE